MMKLVLTPFSAAWSKRPTPALCAAERTCAPRQPTQRHKAIMSKSEGRFEVKRTATGLGLFALQPIAAGKRIIEYTGPLISNEEVEKSRGRYFFGVNSRWSIDGSPRSN